MGAKVLEGDENSNFWKACQVKPAF
jgi:hypothetical protein